MQTVLLMRQKFINLFSLITNMQKTHQDYSSTAAAFFVMPVEFVVNKLMTKRNGRTCWLSGTRRTNTSATLFASVLLDDSTILSRRTVMVASSLKIIINVLQIAWTILYKLKCYL